MNRKHFISTLAGAAVTTAVTPKIALAGSIDAKSELVAPNAVPPAPKHKVKRGVCLYSYQQTMMFNRITLEECFEEMSSLGAYGLEAIGQVFIKDYPNPTSQFVDEYWRLIDKYGLTPVSYTNFHDKYLQFNPQSLDDNVEYQTRAFKLGKMFGFNKFRMLVGTPIPLLERMMPIAEKMGIWMGLEIHAPTHLDSELVKKIVSMAKDAPDVIGLYPDMGIFQRYPRPYKRDQQVKKGTLTRDIALYIEDSFKKGVAQEEVEKQVKKMKPKDGDTAYIASVYRSAGSYQNPKDLIPLLPYCKNIHGKFYQMSTTEPFTDLTVNYEEPLKVLMENGYDGYICSEYEGQRDMDIPDVDEIAEVRRQHVMLKRILGV